MSKGVSVKKKQQQAACAACTVILIIIIIILVVLYFVVYRPKDPRVQVPAMQLTLLSAPSTSFAAAAASASPSSTANVSLNLQISIYNSNKATFIVEDGSIACIYYYGVQVGFTPVPAGSIPAQSFSTITVPLAVQGSSPLQGQNLLTDLAAGILHISTAVIITGKVTTINLFTHHADVVSRCNVDISLNGRGIISYTCQRSTTLDPS